MNPLNSLTVGASLLAIWFLFAAKIASKLAPAMRVVPKGSLE
jgi:hypothetical protein